jgi:hypothetical protein
MTTPKKAAAKAPAKKSPAKKKPTTGRPAPKPTNAEEAPAVVEELKTVTFQGREIKVKLPTPEQLLAWERLLAKLEKVSKEAATVDSLKTILNRVTRIIDSVVVSEDDREWLEDGRMDGTVTIENASTIVLDALKAYEEDGQTPAGPMNRAARRAKA